MMMLKSYRWPRRGQNQSFRKKYCYYKRYQNGKSVASAIYLFMVSIIFYSFGSNRSSYLRYDMNNLTSNEIHKNHKKNQLAFN